MLEYENFLKACSEYDKLDLTKETKVFVCEASDRNVLLEDANNLPDELKNVDDKTDSQVINEIPIPFQNSWWELADDSKNMMEFRMNNKEKIKDITGTHSNSLKGHVLETFPDAKPDDDFYFMMVLKGVYVVDTTMDDGNNVKFFSSLVRNYSVLEDSSGIRHMEIMDYDFIECGVTENGTVDIKLLNDRSIANHFVTGKNEDKYIEGILTLLRLRILDIEDRLYNSSYCESNYRSKIKLKSNGKKTFYKINKVVSIKPKKSKQKPSSFASNNVRSEYSHGWWVRGHWRNCKGLGKDRNNNYTQKGRTWIIPYTKKDELGIVNKIRVLN